MHTRLHIHVLTTACKITWQNIYTAADAPRTVKVMLGYITDDHDGVQIRTQWYTRIKWNQRVVLQTAKQYCHFFLFPFIVLHIIKITYSMYNVQVYLGSL